MRYAPVGKRPRRVCGWSGNNCDLCLPYCAPGTLFRAEGAGGIPNFGRFDGKLNIFLETKSEDRACSVSWKLAGDLYQSLRPQILDLSFAGRACQTSAHRGVAAAASLR